MSDARAALEQLIAALERHYEAANSSRDPDHPMVIAAAQDLAEAFDDYDEALFDATEVATPLAVYGEDLDMEEDDSDDTGVYAGLDSDDYDSEDDDSEDDESDDDESDDDEDDDEDYDFDEDDEEE
jgi:pyruvate/2-oxoacid:ferredoxin oxidoreductase alpha subunit